MTALFLCGFAYAGAYQVNASANSTAKNQSAEMEYAVIKGEKWYYIVNETQLRAIGNSQDSMNMNYYLGNDIQLTSDWKPIGTKDLPFTGSFD